MAGLTAVTAPLPHETQRFINFPAGERSSMALTCASEHSCGSLLAPPMLVDKLKTGGAVHLKWDVWPFKRGGRQRVIAV